MTIKVLMVPHGDELGDAVSGISRVVEAYFKHLPKFDIDLVEKNATTYDIKAAHAGITAGDCDVCHCHGLHWTGNYTSPKWEYKVNARVIEAIRNTKEVTVPSQWVAKAFQRDMRFTPHIIPHGIDWADWQEPVDTADYMLYNKNRQGDVCDASAAVALARLMPNVKLLTTFAPRRVTPSPNVKVIGLTPFAEMKQIVKCANVYLALTQETFGIGTLEAMAAGVPVLAYNHGGNAQLVKHGVTGYLAQPGNLDDLAAGLEYCLKYRQVLGENGRELAKQWTWERACKMVANVYAEAMLIEPATAAIIIPCYNYSQVVGEAIESASAQTYKKLIDIIVVDDGSEDSEQTRKVVNALAQRDSRIRYIHQQNMGVAYARNAGIAATMAKYIVCLDADDKIHPEFMEKLIPPMEQDSTLGITYAGLALRYEKDVVHGEWPTEFNYDEQLKGHNQIPTCCVFRRKIWERLGGYRQRYADPKLGCGAEDAEFWLRVGSIGFGAKKVTNDDLFIYRLGGNTQRGGFKDTGKWLDWHPWSEDRRHPFASVATPKLHSHSVRHYTNPLVSVIIPVGPGHEDNIIQALDSVDAQTSRKWEVIVVWDVGSDVIPDRLLIAYPYVNWLHSSDVVGTGAARNLGAQAAVAPLLLFLDADDYLLPNAIEEFLLCYKEYQSIVYSESLGIRAIDKAAADQYNARGELLKYEHGIAAIRQSVGDYLRDVAVEQPYTDRPYFWCYISSLVPKAWHAEVGGFDESLETWEDWDYWIRLAKAGKPFVPVNKPLMVYNYDTGMRREYGCSIKHEVLGILREKHKEIEIMSCHNCGKNTVSSNRHSTRGAKQKQGKIKSNLKTEDFILCTYIRQKRGSHAVIGTSAFTNRLTDRMRRVRNGWVFDYSYHSMGDVFLIHRRDAQAMPTWFSEVRNSNIDIPIVEQVAPEPPMPIPVKFEVDVTEDVSDAIEIEVVANALEVSTAVKIDEEFDIQSVPGVTVILAKRLQDAGFDTLELLATSSVEALIAVKGVGYARAAKILSGAYDLSVEDSDDDEVVAELGKILG